MKMNKVEEMKRIQKEGLELFTKILITEMQNTQ
jgi:hypothetical protein